MDGTLFQYLRLKSDKAVEAAFRLQDEVEAVGGCFSLLWHYRAFPGGQYPEWAEVFEAILSRASGDGAVFLTHADVAAQRKKWVEFAVAFEKTDESVAAVIRGTPGTDVLTPDGWTAGDKNVKSLKIPTSGALKVPYRRNRV